jgi:hypothetical protein
MDDHPAHEVGAHEPDAAHEVDAHQPDAAHPPDVAHAPEAPSLNRLAAQATTHCLTGCAIGEIAGLVVATQLGWSNAASIVLATVLAFFFGYSLTLRPLLASGLALSSALGIAFAADSLSITVMEVIDNLTVLVVPGAMDAGITDGLFWITLIAGLAIAWVAAFPVNRWLIARGQGHVLAMRHHDHEM